MSNANSQQSPALRMEAGSINCILVYISLYAANRNLLTVADSLPAKSVEYLLYIMRLILLIHIIRRTPDGLYEIARTPGEGDKHTLYFKGLYGDIFSQMTRNDAALITDASTLSFPKFSVGNLSLFKSSDSLEVAKSPDLFELAGLSGVFPFAKGDTFPPNFKGVTVNTNKADIEALEMSTSATSFFCQDIAGSCSQYYVNTAKYYYLQSAFKVARVVYSVEYDVFVWLLLVVVIALTPYFIPIGLFSLSFPSPFVRKEMLSGRGGYTNKSFITENSGEGDSWFAKRTLSVTPLLTVAILFTFTQCGIIGGGKNKGDAPWLLLASGVNSNTPSVDDASSASATGSSGGGLYVEPAFLQWKFK